MILPNEAVRTRNMSEKDRLAAIVGGSSLVLYGLRKRSGSGWAVAALGGGMVYCGAIGYSPVMQALGLNTNWRDRGRNTSVPYELGVRIDRAITIGRPPQDLWDFWRNLDNLPRIMRNLVSVRITGDRRSHWVMKGPGGKTLEWDAEIVDEEAPKRIGWRSLPGSRVEHAGSIHFEPAGERGTVVRVEMQYNPPGGYVGAGLAKLLHDPADALEDDLRHFKQLMETGENPSAEGQPRGAMRSRTRQAIPERPVWRDSDVTEASEESFPASDAPSWTPERL